MKIPPSVSVRRLTARAVGVLLVVGPALTAGCKCGSDKPFVPYTIDPLDAGGAPSVSAPGLAVSGAAPAESASGARVPGAAPPRGATVWELGGQKLSAPPGRIFSAGVALADGVVVALVTDGAGSAGELVRYAAGEAVTLVKLPAFLPSGADCELSPRVYGTGRASVALDVASVCKSADPVERRPDRYVAVVSLASRHAVELEVRPVAQGTRLDLDVDGADRDGDGRDDVSVQLSLEGTQAPVGAATATLRWVDRDGGFSREATEPALSLRLAASWLASQAAKRPDVVRPGRQRLLAQELCAEPTIVRELGGQAFACADPAATEDLVFAEARAQLAKGAMLESFSSLTLLRATRPKAKRTLELERALEETAKPKKVRARPLKAMPVPSSVALPLAFGADGKLSVLTADGVVSVDAVTGDEAAPVAGTPFSPFADLVEGMRVESATDRCKTEPVLLHVRGTRDLVLPLVGATSPLCPKSVLPALLDRTDSGLSVLVSGVAFEIPADGSRAVVAAWPAGAGGRGTIRSPHGTLAALAGRDRVLLVGDGRSEVWKPTTFFTLNACTAADGWKAVACVLDAGAVLLTP